MDHVENRCANNPTYNFWNSYLNMVSILLAFVRGTRTGNFQLHLESLRLMLPWFFAYDRVNYARYAPIYWTEMSNLSDSHPWLYRQLMESQGAWTFQRHHSTGFNGLAADQAIETTVNKESKTRGGLTGLTMNTGALQRWI